MSTFDPFAREYSERAGSLSVLDLLGDVAGLRVLDAGSGPGVHLAALAERGASALGIDESEAFVAIARERLAGRAEVVLGDLDAVLAEQPAGAFDRALLSGVLHHLADPVRTLTALRRVLAPGGRLVVSTHHPTADWLRFGGSYFDVTGEERAWGETGGIRVRRAPLSVLSADFAAAGFVIAQIVEPRGGHEGSHEGHGQPGGDGPDAIVFVLEPRVGP